ncbi:competence protein ComGC [Dellaglioa algida]|uniref:competence type IV pilus major pilin ComGC n=1 Tax=Dellaglioa carnosa TaxID=2995136 RepID=UPI0011B4025E|nr:competence type IV pilus major pilin ComGC [Dellaglioa carnosa]MCZ2492917.1 competence type IV pilus major pilin ComGC [Dellaglioa carnosa]TWW12962.1 competence protein ComGC [Dellaglioa algida]
MKNNRKKLKAFTLVEMLCVLFIISLLMLIILPNIGHQRTSAKHVNDEALVSVVQTQVDLYENETHNKSINFSDLVSEKYLTEKQEKEAQANHIIISNNVVKTEK